MYTKNYIEYEWSFILDVIRNNFKLPQYFITGRGEDWRLGELCVCLPLSYKIQMTTFSDPISYMKFKYGCYRWSITWILICLDEWFRTRQDVFVFRGKRLRFLKVTFQVLHRPFSGVVAKRRQYCLGVFPFFSDRTGQDIEFEGGKDHFTLFL